MWAEGGEVVDVPFESSVSGSAERSVGDCRGEGVEAVVSPTMAGVSIMATSPGFLAEEIEDALARVPDVTSEETPILGRLLCFWCSVSEGDLDLFRLESAASGMTEFSQRDNFSGLSFL